MPCLLPKYVDPFIAKLKSGEIDLNKFAEMTSEQRHEFFSNEFGKENAQWVNAALEKKLLLKYQNTAIVNWAKQIANMKPEVRRDILSRVEKMDKLLTPEEGKGFYSDLAAQKLGVGVTSSEAAHILQLSKDATAKRTAMKNRRMPGQPGTAEEAEYGRAVVAFNNYLNNLKLEAQKQPVGKAVVEAIKPGNWGKTITEAAGTAKAIKASMDNSALFRQGWKPLWTNPKIWANNAKQSFRNIVDTFKGKPVMDELMADIVSRPNYDRMTRAKLDIGNLEEAYPTTLPEKMPVFGKAYKASEVAFTAFQRKMRADLFDHYLDIAEKSGVDINNKQQLESIGKMVNSLTGRGYLGKLERAAGAVNNIFFSPRFFKSNADALTLGQFQGEMTPFARKQAAIASLKVIGGTAATLGLAGAVGKMFDKDNVVELDPRSSDFGKIRIGNTRFDVSGGSSTIVTLASRLLTNSKKSSTTGRVTRYGEGFKADTRKDAIYDFFEGKLSPAAAVAVKLLEGKDYNGRIYSILDDPLAVAKDVTAPLPLQNLAENYNELKKNPKLIDNIKDTELAAQLTALFIIDGLGIGTNIYSRKKAR